MANKYQGVSKGWRIGCIVMTILAILFLVSWLGCTSQYATLQNKYTALSQQQSQTNATNTANIQSQQQCIQHAQAVANAAPTLTTTAVVLGASVSACKAAYPTS